jgi:hypothetical protein
LRRLRHRFRFGLFLDGLVHGVVLSHPAAPKVSIKPGQAQYHDPVRNMDYTGWRLPKVEPLTNNGFNHEFRLEGTTDEGYNITSQRSEFSYMYYVNLGLDGWWTKDGKHPKTFGVMKSWTAVWRGQADLGLVKNLQSDGYYCASPGQPYPSPTVWIFTTSEGNQRDGLRRPDAGFVWPVHDGDITAGVTKPAAK